MTAEDHTHGPVPCDQVGMFVDGELDAAQAEAFRHHLVQCARCQSEMHALMQLAGLAEEAGRKTTETVVAPRRVQVAAHRPVLRRALMGVGGLAAMAAAALLAIRSRTPEVPQLLASLDSRAVSGWPSAMGPKDYRSYQTMRGTTAGNGADPLARAQLRFESSGDLRGLATVAILRRDFPGAEQALNALPQTPDVLVDRGLIRLEQSRCGEALEYFDRALFRDPENLPARFNRGLCLKQLRLPLAAERALGPVASSATGGWSQEAKVEEQRLERTRTGYVQDEKALNKLFDALIESQSPLTAAHIASQSSLARLTYYHAVSSAQDLKELERLRVTARALDQAFGGDLMERRLERVIKATRPNRGPLAARYRAWALKRELRPQAEALAFRNEALKDGQDDIAIQVIDQFANGDVSAQRERLVREFDDPWHAVRLAAAQATRLLDEGRAGDAERVLRAALERCRPESMAASCWYPTSMLGDLYVSVGRPSDARRVFAAAAPRLRAGGLRGHERKALVEVARIAAQAGEVGLAQASFEEMQLREPGWCRIWAWAHELIAQGFVRAGEPERVPTVLKDPPGCTLDPEPWRATWRIDLGLLTGDRKVLTEARQLAAATLAFPDASRAEKAQGQLLESEADLALGVPGAEDTLRHRVDALGEAGDAGLRSAIARSRQALVLAALGRGDGQTAFAELAKLQHTQSPAVCATGFVSDVARAGWVTVGTDGSVRSAVTATRAAPALPAEELARLGACTTAISVLSAGERPVGASLPDSLAWAFRVGDATSAGPLGKERLMVRDVLSPPELQLPPLGSRGSPGDGDWTVLSGADATPRRVLAGLERADVIDFEVHGIVDAQVPDGAVLVLSEDENRDYALSATELQNVRLSRRPVVLLGACRAATPSRLRAEPWSLPGTLVRSGARAVFASLQDLPDHEVGDFYRRVLSRLDAGEAPAVALRNERLEWVKTGKVWVRDVVLFD